MNIKASNEIYSAATDKSLAETGGAHNIKGVEFQRHWAILHLIKLEESGQGDFMFLFEALQDVSVLDSSTAPTSICIYQVKKKDRNEWKWGGLTSLPEPEDPSKPKKKASSKASSSTKPAKAVPDIRDSPIGKLYATVQSFKSLKSSGRFISNAGCDLPLATGSNVATSLPSALSELAPQHVDALNKQLAVFHQTDGQLPDLSCIYLERTALPVDELETYVVGAVHKFLLTRSPRHAGQAKSLVDALLVKIGPLGGKTDTCKTFDEIRAQHGYSKQEFLNALGNLESVPDTISILEIWLNKLLSEDMDFFEITGIRMAATSIYRNQVMRANSQQEEKIFQDCDQWIASNPITGKLKPIFDNFYEDLKHKYSLRKSELLAHFAIRAIAVCEAQF